MGPFTEMHRRGQNSEVLSGFLSAICAAPQRKPCARRMAKQIGRFDTSGDGAIMNQEIGRRKAPDAGGRAAPVSSLSILPRCGSSAAERLPATPPVTAWRGMANLAGRWETLRQRSAFFARRMAHAAR